MSVFDLISRVVQSAVNPVWNLVASLGANDLPSAVAQIKTELGFCAAIHSATTSV